MEDVEIQAMSMQSNQPRGKIYIPPCRNATCNEWILKIAELLKPDLECVTKHIISGPFTFHFKRHSQECDFTVFHFCHSLWKRVSKIKDILREQERKLILVRFKDEKLTANNWEASVEEISSVESFFIDFDSEQVISDNEEILKSFKDDIFSCLKENLYQNDIADLNSRTCTEVTQAKENEIEADESEEEEVEILNFENYPEFISNVNQNLYVGHKIVQLDGHINISFEKNDTVSLKKTMQEIDELGRRHSKEVTSTLKYIIRQMIPTFYRKKDVVKLASFSMCRNPLILGRALDCLELLLWDNVDKVQDFTLMNYVQDIFTVALYDLKHDYGTSKKREYLMMLQRVANLYLIVVASIFIQSHETPDIVTKCYDYFDTRSRSPFVSTRQVDQKTIFDLEKQFDENLCLGLLDCVYRGAGDCRHKSAQQILGDLDKSENLFGKMIKKGMAVHLMVVTQLMRDIFSCSEGALNTLEKYMDGPKGKSPFVYLILHSLTLFLAYKTQEISHKDINTICKNSVLIIRKAIPNGEVKQVDNFLQRLLFNSNPTIRQEMIKLFKETDRYGLLSTFQQKEIEQQLSPLLVNFKFQSTSGGKFGWKKASGRFNDQDVWIFLYCMTEKDHKRNQITFSDQHVSYIEMKRLAELQHSKIIRMFAYQHDCIPTFYIIETCDQHLQGHLQNKKKNSSFFMPSQLLQFLLDAVTALEHCHKKSYVHCNLTAESLIVFNDTHVKLAGFGQSKMIDTNTGKARFINSEDIPIRWSAPESILEGEYSKSSDIWMVGLLLCEVMTHGQLPYSNMTKDDVALIELMKSKKLIPTIDPVVERNSILQLLSECTSYEQEKRIHVANVKSSLRNLLIRVKQTPERKSMLSKFFNFDEKKSSTNFKKGIPEQFHIRTGVTSSLNVKQTVNVSQNMERTKEGKDFIFREKIHHQLSTTMETSFHSPKLDDILPTRRKIVQYASEMKHIECIVPNENCFCLLDVAFKKLLKDVKDIILLMQKVAAKIAGLFEHSYVIGDISASHVYVELTDPKKVHIISLAFLRKINCEEELNQIEDVTENVKRRASPELLQNGRFSASSDVFCFGNFMWEMLAAFSQENQASLFFNKTIRVFRKLREDEICDAILSGKWEEHHPRPKRCPESLYELIKSCVNTRENERPAMAYVATELTKEHSKASNEVLKDCNEGSSA